MNKQILFLAFSVLCFLGVHAQQNKTDTIRFSNPHNDIALYIRDWKFKIGDDPSWADKDYNDKNWKTFNQKNNEADINFLIKEGFRSKAWFRKQLYFDSTNYKYPFAFKITQTGAMEVYIDGVKKDTYGEIGPNGKDKFENQYRPLFFTLQQPGWHTIALRFSKKNLEDKVDESATTFSILLFTAFGIYNNVKSNLLEASSLILVSGVFFFVLFIIHMLMFFFYRKDKSNLYFAIFNLGMSGLWISLYLWVIVTSITLEDILLYCSVISGFIAFIALSTFINNLFSKFGWRYRIIVSLGIISLIAMLVFDDIELTSFILPTLFFSLIFIEAIIIMIRAIIRKVPGAAILGTGILSFIFSFVAILTYGVINNEILFSFDNVWTILLFLAIFILVVYSIPLSLSAYLAWKVANTNRHLASQIQNVETLSREKQSILENQKQILEVKVNERTNELQIEKKKSDDLLRNILPEEIAEELKQNGSSEAQNFEEVSVLFTDFVNFTKLSEQLGVKELLHELNINFTAFDHIMEQHGMEKIKTIGDAYLAVSGLPMPNGQHAKNAVLAALEIIDFVEQRKSEVPYGLDIRIGINSGSVIAGIIGVKKFAYDIWGDTVNIAARMEQTGAAGKVNISENTYNLINHEFICKHRGKIAAKNKGEMDMYFVKSKIIKDGI